MPKFITFDDIESIQSKFVANSRNIQESIGRVERKAIAQQKGTRTFLSHSSKDEKYLPGIMAILQNHGAKVYCDLQDGRMPKPPSKKTAEILKDEIQLSRRLVLFVTENSYNSRWVPWELGLGDAILNPRNVALFPASHDEDHQSWASVEYLGIYSRIVYGRLSGHNGDVWMVLDGEKNVATHLKDWF